ncbi:xanthine dehydrogenase family protein molybdopterin-binding subunit [Seohaeicola saemankumensis]|nr:xanthine dehydrogenase family protein molybdopterin-binding subunit [Seohaeicola saemankumensis]MCA0873557.1 xanthine dehydrogenase family protein molybdopterin-binding subunit [Seohaeicola saemankumensis]
MAQTRRGRIEDQRFLTGKGQYGDDTLAGDALHAVFVRADVAAGRLVSLATDDAAEMPGVAAVLTGADLAADGVGPVQVPMKLTGPDGRVWTATRRPLLAGETVRHVGEPLAIVLAETRAQAMDAAEMVEVEIEDTPAVASLDEARAPDAPLVDPDMPGNLCFQWARGDWEAAGAAIAGAHHRVRLVTPITRVAAAPMEPRNAIARPIEDGRMEILCSHQNPVALRPALAHAMNMEAEAIRCRAGDVGGAFGMKSGPLREECVVFWAARRLSRAVRWTATRVEAFLSDESARDMCFTSELGMDAEGNFIAMRFLMDVNSGAYASMRSAIPMANLGGVAGVYRTPLIAGRMDGYLSHTVPTAPYRGAGRPEATLAVEGLIDKAARQAGIDRIELRRRNLIRADEMPWKSPFIFDYDCGDFERVLDAGLARGDVSGFAARQAASEARGLVRGLGLAMCVETAGGLYANPGRDFADVEVHADGSVTLSMGSLSAGSGLETVMTDLAAQAFELPPARVTYLQGNTDVMDRGKGMGGSAAMAQGAPALRDGVQKAIAKARAIAGDMMEAAEADIEYSQGAFRIAGTDRSVTLAEVAQSAADRGERLLGEGGFAPDAPTFPNGCHLCEVEIDPETGQCTIASYTGVEDIGTVINPQLAEGQIHGGVVQGLGQMLCEETRYSPGDGQLLTASFMDYAMPRAGNMPGLNCGFEEVPTALNPLGAKGVGEAGTVGALAAGMSAITDAMRQLGVEDFEMPASPGRIWQALQEG